MLREIIYAVKGSFAPFINSMKGIIIPNMWNNIFRSADILQRGLNASWTRNAVIRNNIANAETPNFQASDVEFESHLARSLQSTGFRGTMTHPGHREIGGFRDFDSVTPQIVQRRGSAMRIDGNNVDIEAQNVMLAQNSIQYNAIVEKLNGELRRLRLAITEAR